jgi:hypothetical protein
MAAMQATQEEARIRVRKRRALVASVVCAAIGGYAGWNFLSGGEIDPRISSVQIGMAEDDLVKLLGPPLVGPDAPSRPPHEDCVNAGGKQLSFHLMRKGILPVYSRGKSFLLVCIGKDARVVGRRLHLVNFL